MDFEAGKDFPPALLEQVRLQRLGVLGPMEIWRVDGERIRGRVDIDFVAGGNPARYAYVPAGEIWVEGAGLDVPATALHEVCEWWLMTTRSMTYEDAHDLADVAERRFRREYEGSVPSLDQVASWMGGLATEGVQSIARRTDMGTNLKKLVGQLTEVVCGEEMNLEAWTRWFEEHIDEIQPGLVTEVYSKSCSLDAFKSNVRTFHKDDGMPITQAVAAAYSGNGVVAKVVLPFRSENTLKSGSVMLEEMRQDLGDLVADSLVEDMDREPIRADEAGDRPANEHDFLRVVLSKLPKLADPGDRRNVEAGIKLLFHRGWSVGDAVALNRVSQEFDPDYPEDAALRIMSRIQAKYR